MEKVGIMSMQRIANYGSFLQAYALRCLLEDLTCRVQFVDYRVEPPLIRDPGDSGNPALRKVKKGLETLGYPAPLSQKLEFIRYKRSFGPRYLPLLGIGEEKNYDPELDCLVIGSDEVFNCVQKNTNVGYSLDLFGRGSRARRRITYAASFGNTTLEKLEKFGKTAEIGKLLGSLDALSVRDRNSGRIVEALTGRTPRYHLDPVLTYDYLGRCDRIPTLEPREDYLILYAYSGRISPAESRWIRDYARKRGLKVYTIGGVQSCGDRFLDCGPFEVLAYFQNAREVITDTFHGTIFSVITHRPFVSLIRRSVGDGYGNEEKLTDLLDRLGLSDRAAGEIGQAAEILARPMDGAGIDALLARHRREAMAYLRENITEEEG